MTDDQLLLFAPRFLESHAGASVLRDPVTAIVELVANAWDARATDVHITWPDEARGDAFKIEDNGHGMTADEFNRRWFTLSYDRRDEQGLLVRWTGDKGEQHERPAFGSNGIGRHAIFCFCDSYVVQTWRDGMEHSYRVRRGTTTPLAKVLLGSRKRAGHGTIITADQSRNVPLSSAQVRAEIGVRFLTDPHFIVRVDRKAISFGDLPTNQIDNFTVDGGQAGQVFITVLDTRETDRTAKQHGIAWHVLGRLVGKCSWDGTDHERFLDGRRAEAKRYTFLVRADGLRDAVEKDWRRFDPENAAYQDANRAVQAAIRDRLISLTKDKRAATARAVRNSLSTSVSRLTPLSRETWSTFVDRAIETCPSLSERELTQLAGVLANLEDARSKYGLIQQLNQLKPGDLDDLHQLLNDWTLRFAKVVLDEVEGRLRLVDELSSRVADSSSREVQDLQPLFKRGLWIFGPEYETIEYTSNVGMTRVLQDLFRSKETGSLHRPDFAILPDSTVGLYSYPRYDSDGGEVGVDKLTIIELKKPGVRISTDEKAQAWKYVKELYEKGCITKDTTVTCFVLGSHIDPLENSPRREDDKVTIQPLRYDTVLKRAESRLLRLYDRVKEAPFLDQHAISYFLNEESGEQISVFEMVPKSVVSADLAS